MTVREEQTIPAVVAAAAARWPDAIALETPERRWTFAALFDEVRAAAGAFIAAGIGKGDRVAIWAPNSPEWIIATIGAQLAGAAIVPLNTRFKGKEAAYILNKSGAKLLLTVTDFLGVDYPALIAAETLPHLQRTVLLEGRKARIDDWSSFIAAGRAVDASRVDAALAALGPDDIADIMFTSGTTGDPKGVMSAHGQNVRTYGAWCDAVGLRHGDRYLIVNPFFHTFGYKAGWLVCLLAGATILPVAVFDAGEVLARVARDRITVLPGPPALFQSMLAHPDCATFDRSTLRVTVTGAASVPAILIRRMKSDLGFETVLTGYGLTESTGTVTLCKAGDSPELVASSCGTAIPGVEVRIADDAGRPMPTGEPGEVLVRGFNVMRGYLDDPKATAEAIDADGWLHTGDIGTLDAEGYLRITDRKKEMFITGGFNCYPAEIERLISEHPDVAQVAVIGVPDERMGEVCRAFIVPKSGAAIDEASLIAWCRNAMANYKVPRSVRFVDALPMTASGKVQRFALRELDAVS